jgi:hypothetical protein
MKNNNNEELTTFSAGYIIGALVYWLQNFFETQEMMADVLAANQH